jgi:hypothetical protein
MEKISEIIQNHHYWSLFSEHKLNSGHLSDSEKEDLIKYVENKEYLPVSEKFLNTLSFSYPKIKILPWGNGRYCRGRQT